MYVTHSETRVPNPDHLGVTNLGGPIHAVKLEKNTAQIAIGVGDKEVESWRRGMIQKVQDMVGFECIPTCA